MKRIVLLLFICVCVMAFAFCEKKLFGSVQVKGRLIHYLTGEPTGGTVSLMADDVHSSSNYAAESVELTSGSAKSDGRFTLKSRLSKGSNYYLHVNSTQCFDPVTRQSKIEIVKHGVTDMGDLLAGTCNFICKVTLMPVSNKSIWLFDPTKFNSFTYFPPGTTVTVIQQRELDALAYIASGRKFLISCRIDDYNSSDYYILPNATFYVPILSGDTVRYQINY